MRLGPASPAQERLWFHAELEPKSPAYNMAHVFRLTGEIDVEALEAAINGVLARHEALRTTFHGADGRPIQVVTPDAHLDLKRVDLVDRRLDADEN